MTKVIAALRNFANSPKIVDFLKISVKVVLLRLIQVVREEELMYVSYRHAYD
jgi:hypothetical protein